MTQSLRNKVRFAALTGSLTSLVILTVLLITSDASRPGRIITVILLVVASITSFGLILQIIGERREKRD